MAELMSHEQAAIEAEAEVSKNLYIYLLPLSP
jgi:hypothetical protein